MLIIIVPLRIVVAQSRTITASGVIARIIEHADVAVPNSTVDTFKAGDPGSTVRGIAVTMMATLDVLQRAAAKGDNLIITHEPTFYSHRDTLAVLESERDPVLAAKRKFIADHGLVVWRFHDIPHRMTPDMITQGVIRVLGWDGKKIGTSDQLFAVAPTTLAGLASMMSKALGANAARIIGDPKARVSSVGLTEGFPGFAANRHVFQSHGLDVLVIGEDHEWETIEYATDAIASGQLKGIIVLGHIPSEQAGMIEVTRWLKTFITEVPIEFVATKDVFQNAWTARHGARKVDLPALSRAAAARRIKAETFCRTVMESDAGFHTIANVRPSGATSKFACEKPGIMSATGKSHRRPVITMLR